MWRRWTTEWTLSCGEQQLALGLLSGARDPGAEPETIGHEDTPTSRAAALREALARWHARHPGAVGCRRVRVLLDDRWSVWTSLQGAFWALSAAQRETLVRGHLTQQMGTDPGAWRVSSHVTSDGEGLSACALVEARIAEVLEAVQAAGLQAVSLRPSWVDRLERLAPRLTQTPCLVARADGDLLCLALRGAKDWLRIGSLQVDQDADWSPRALGWWQGLGLPAQDLVCVVDGAAHDCPPGWSPLERS